jgi:murein L,D-transpeptidase YcbB/YkuD
VQEWEKMALYIINNENTVNATAKPRPVPVDSLMHWLEIKEKHSIPIKAKVPVFIRYFTCEVNNGQIDFFEDIYDEDKKMTELLFANKKNGE